MSPPPRNEPNPYAPSAASLDELARRPAAAEPASGGDPSYFAVSIAKLAALSICTLGVYEVYWFYRNWVLIRDRERLHIRPFWRAIFAVFFCYQCFRHINQRAQELELQPRISAGPLATVWIVLTLLWRLPDPYWLVTLFAFIPMLPVQALANRVNAADAPGHDPNRRYSAWNIVGIVVGVMFLSLALIGTFMPAATAPDE